MVWIALRTNLAVVVKKSEEKFVVADRFTIQSQTHSMYRLCFSKLSEWIFWVFFWYNNTIENRAEILYPQYHLTTSKAQYFSMHFARKMPKRYSCTIKSIIVTLPIWESNMLGQFLTCLRLFQIGLFIWDSTRRLTWDILKELLCHYGHAFLKLRSAHSQIFTRLHCYSGTFRSNGAGWDTVVQSCVLKTAKESGQMDGKLRKYYVSKL